MKKFIVAGALLLCSVAYSSDQTDAVTKAFAKVNKVDNRKFVRMTLAPDYSDDNDRTAIFAEFGDGSLGIWCDDQWILLDKKNVKILEECATRVLH